MSDAPLADVGIVFVHGIGDHRESETLLTFGEPLTDWLAEWLRLRGGDVRILDARLRATRTEAESPAFSLAEIRTKSHTHKCLMTEAWWGESVRPPDPLKLLRWLFYRGPLLIFAHYELGRLQVAPIFVLRSVRPIVLSAAVQLLALVAMVLWIIPLDVVRRRIAGIVRVLTLTLGDSFVLLEQEFQRAAFVARVRAATTWVSEHVEHVVVIAHSQGGAIAHEALAGADVKKLRQFITVGSGLEKLYFLREVRRDRRALLPAALTAPFALGAALSWWGSTDEPWLNGPLWVFGVGLFFVLVLLNVYLEGLGARLSEALRDAPISAPWLDLYASHDLVSAGRHSLLPESVRRERVINLRSLLRDHTTYFERPEQSPPMLWSAIANAAGWEPWAFALDRVARFHRWHTLALNVSFWTTLAAVASALVVFRVPLAEAGVQVQQAVDWGGLDRINRTLMALSDAGLPPPRLVWAAVSVVVVYLLCWRGFAGLWTVCAADRWRRSCRSTSRATWSAVDAVAPSSIMVGASLPLVLVVAAAFGLLPAVSARQAGSGVFFVLTFCAAVFYACGVSVVVWGTLLKARVITALAGLAGVYLIVLMALGASRFFWDTGAFRGPSDAILGIAVGIVAVVWTAACIRDGRRYARVAASAPWLGMLTGYGVGGVAAAMFAALGSTILAQIVVVVVYAQAIPDEDHDA